MTRIPSWYTGFHHGTANKPREKRTTKRAQPERQFQVALVKTLRRHARCPWWAVPNGGYRHLYVATKLKAEGVRRGTPDLCFIVPPTGRAAFLELKALNGSLSPEQKQFRDDALQCGALWEYARSIDDAYRILAEWGVLPITTEFQSESNAS
jgi:hypothetical protein